MPWLFAFSMMPCIFSSFPAAYCSTFAGSPDIRSVMITDIRVLLEVGVVLAPIRTPSVPRINPG